MALIGKSKARVQVIPASLAWGQTLCRTLHYRKTAVHGKARPFCYRIEVNGREAGFIIVGEPSFRKLKNHFGYEGLPSSHQVLVLYRFFIFEEFQDRSQFQNIGSMAIGRLMRRIQKDWLLHDPPPDPEQPYHIRLLISFSQTNVGHSGGLYRACNFQYAGKTTGNTRSKQTGLQNPLDKEPKDRWVFQLPQPTWTWEGITPGEQLALPWASVGKSKRKLRLGDFSCLLRHKRSLGRCKFRLPLEFLLPDVLCA